MMEYEIHYVWLPCKKRMPETAGWYLATLNIDGKDWNSYTFKKYPDGVVEAWAPFPDAYSEV